MATTLFLMVLSHSFINSDSIGIREIFISENGTDIENGNVGIGKNRADNLIPDGHDPGNVISPHNETLINLENDDFLTNRVGEAGVLGNETLMEMDSHMGKVEHVRVDLNETTQGTTYSVGSNFKLPQKWTDFCVVAGLKEYSSEFTPPVNLTVIRCDVTPEYSGILTMHDLRQHLEAYNSSELKYSVAIECSSWSNVSVSWPMKLAGVYSLVVKHCQILDFLSEFNEPLIQSTPDSLRRLDISHNRVLIATDRYIDITRHVRDILPEYNCGHDATLEYMSVQNLTYHFIDSIDFVYNQLTALGEQFILDAWRLPAKCDFRHLMVLEEGLSSSMSIYHTELKNSNFYELRVYNLSHSYIKALKDKQLQWSLSFPKLEMYDLSHNHISKLYRFEIPLHTRKEQITTINLQYNRINSIAVEDLERFKMMPTMFIDLRNNPIDCNCTENMKQLLSYIRQNKYLEISNLTDYSYIKNLTCAGPKRLQFRTLGSLTDISELCQANVETEYFLVPILILSCTIVVLSVLLLLLLRYRKEVLIIMFTRFNIIVPCHQRHRGDSSKRYDAFVSYSSKEEEWVESVFGDMEQQLIDSGRHFRFCLHHRDFIPGKTIFDNVIKSVENSRHTIILLSNNFLKSEFCLYEFQEAFRQSIMEQKRHLVIVMMEELDADKLPRDLRRCIKTFTYIRKDEYLFRERLIYALSTKQKHRVVESKKQTVTYTTPKGKSSKIYSASQKDVQHSEINENPSGKLSNSVLTNEQIKSESLINGECCRNGHLQTNKDNRSAAYDKSTTGIHTSDSTNSPKRRSMKRNSDKTLALNIESECRGSPGAHHSTQDNTKYEYDSSDSNEALDTFDATEIPRVEIVLRSKAEYDRSISTVSRDTGYSSEKGSPDICSVDGDLDKHMFAGVDDIDVTDFVV